MKTLWYSGALRGSLSLNPLLGWVLYICAINEKWKYNLFLLFQKMFWSQDIFQQSLLSDRPISHILQITLLKLILIYFLAIGCFRYLASLFGFKLKNSCWYFYYLFWTFNFDYTLVAIERWKLGTIYEISSCLFWQLLPKSSQELDI